MIPATSTGNPFLVPRVPAVACGVQCHPGLSLHAPRSCALTQFDMKRTLLKHGVAQPYPHVWEEMCATTYYCSTTRANNGERP